jgi:hypothetical protein
VAAIAVQLEPEKYNNVVLRGAEMGQNESETVQHRTVLDAQK